MIAFVAQPYHRGGVTRWMVDAAVEWAGRGERVWFVCPVPQEPFFSAGSQPPLLTVLDAADPDGRVRRATTSVGTRYELGTERYRASVILTLLRGHVAAGATLVVSDEPAVWRGCHAVAGQYRLIGVLHADHEHYYNLAIRYGATMSALVAVSQRVARTASERLGWPIQRVHTIPCGIPLPPHVPGRVRGELARLIWVGRIEQSQKRVLDLPKILLLVRALGFDATLDIVGDGPDALELRQAFRIAGVEPHVLWHGWRHARDVQQLLSSADVLVLPSNFEGMPIAVMEALAAGCGVAATAVSGLEDYADHPVAARCFRIYEVGDLGTAANSIAALLAASPHERQESARRLAEMEFSIGRCVDRYAEVVRHLSGAALAGQGSLAWVRLAGLSSLPISSLRQLRLRWSGFKDRFFAERLA